MRASISRLLLVVTALVLLAIGGTVFAPTMASAVGGAEGEAVPNVFLDLLRYVPDTPEARTEVMIDDFLAACAALGLERPGPEADYETVADYAFRLQARGTMLPGPFISGFDNYAMITLKTLREQAGYDLRDITSSIIAGHPPQRYSAITLEVPTAEVMGKLLQSQEWPAPEVEEHRGVPVLIWGEDFAGDLDRRLNPPVYDYLGRGARLAFPEGTIFYTLWTDGIRGMIDASLSERPSLADAEDFALLAHGLAELGAYSAWLSNLTQSAEDLPDEEHCRALLRPYEAFATSVARDEDGFFMGLVLVHATAEEAEANAQLLRERLGSCWSRMGRFPWREVFDLERLTITLEGRALVAKAYFKGDRPTRAWISWVLNRDPLLLHE